MNQKIDRIIYCVILVFLFTVLGIEILNSMGVITTVNTTSEGTIPLEDSSNYKKADYISIWISNPENVKFLVNGESLFNYNIEDNVINIALIDGDVVEADLREIKDLEDADIAFKILGLGERVVYPQINEEYKGVEKITKLFQAKIQ